MSIAPCPPGNDATGTDARTCHSGTYLHSHQTLVQDGHDQCVAMALSDQAASACKRRIHSSKQRSEKAPASSRNTRTTDECDRILKQLLRQRRLITKSLAAKIWASHAFTR